MASTNKRLRQLEHEVHRIVPGERRQTVLMVPRDQYDKAMALATPRTVSEPTHRHGTAQREAPVKPNGDLAESELRSLD